MKRLGFLAAIASLFLLSGPVSAHGPSQPATAKATASVHCNGNPEKATLANNTGKSITINSVGSTYQPRSGEPYHVNKSLAAHSSITYQSGTKAHKNVLTHQYLYTDDHRDGVRFKTSVGNFVAHC